MSDATVIQTPEGPMTSAERKKKNSMQFPSRRTKGKNLPKDSDAPATDHIL